MMMPTRRGVFLSGTVNAISPLQRPNCDDLISILKQPPDDSFNQTVKELRTALRKDLDSSPPGDEGWKLMMKYDKYSTRQFLAESVYVLS